MLANLAAGGDGTKVERLAILEKLRRLAMERLNDVDGAMRHAIGSFELDPLGDASRDALRATAEKTGQWGRMADALGKRVAGASAAEAKWLRAQVAVIAADRLGEADRAIEQLRAILAADPTDLDAATSLDRVLRGAKRH